MIPFAKEKEFFTEIHGVKLSDPYRWLQDKDNPDVMKYIDQENDYAESILSKTGDLRDKLFAEMKDRHNPNEITAPRKEGNYLYYAKYSDGSAYPVFIRKSAESGKEEILIDQNELAKEKDFCSISLMRISPDEKKMLYAVDFKGDELYELHIVDIDSKKEIEAPIPNIFGDFEWAGDSKSFFYTLSDEAHRPCVLFYHVIGDSLNRDVKICEQENEEYGLYISVSNSKKYLFINMGAIDSSYVYILPLNDPLADIVALSPNKKGVEYHPYHVKDRFFLKTNENAQNFKILSASDVDFASWTEFIPTDDSIFIDDFEAFDSFVALKIRKDGRFEVKLLSIDSKEEEYVELPEKFGTVEFVGNRESSSDYLRFSFESFVTPVSIFEYHFSSKKLEEIWERKIGNYNKENYSMDRIFATSHDGVKIPITIFYKKDIFKKGESPCFLMGYGAYGYSYDPSFFTDWISLADRGFLCAVAHIRGGEELGRAWYDNGKLLNKKNTFLDYIASAEFLKESKFADRIVAYGRSAGGLLMGAVLTMKPEAFDLVSAEVPFVDTLNTMLDETLPLTIGEYNEWGNPNVKKYFDYIKSYSPYDNITNKLYPPVFMYTALNDTRVMYWEPLKFMAKFRKVGIDTEKSILLIDKSCGHGGYSGRYGRIKEKSALYSFILLNLGLIK